MKHTTTALALLFPLLSPSSPAQGNLDPPAGPAPSMKTLEQVEPRIDVFNAPDTRVDATDPQWAYVIKTPGSYFLSRNMTVGIFTTVPVPEERPNGIRINASDVTLDMQGFTISSGPNVGDGSIAIGISGQQHRVTIHNGTISGSTTVTVTKEDDDWTWSVNAGGFTHGVHRLGDHSLHNLGCRISNITVSGCQQIGIDLGTFAIVESCIATNNGSTGISAFSSTIDRCIAYRNGADGIQAGGGSATNCVAMWNNGPGIDASGGTVSNSKGSSNGGDGIFAFNGSVSHCIAHDNNANGFWVENGSVMNCNAQSNRLTGIEVSASSVTNCVATFNQNFGIHALEGVISGCSASNNNLEIWSSGTRTGNFPTP